ncbi:MAG: diguanylate cyclase [Arcobacter sp.]|uniref:diguanylate cyclase n=1 Tax=Arcobacter sp. TaxID=1872629 RepID=UPI003B00EE9D
MKHLLLKLLLINLFIFTLNAKENEKITLRLDWLNQFQFAGYYVAKEKGFFNEVGLDVDIKEFEYGIDQINEVLEQKANYAVGKSSLIIDKLNGKGIVALASIFQSSPMVLLTTNLSIKKPEDLLHKKVMLTPDARTAIAINSMISSRGVNLEHIDFQQHSFNLNDLITGKTDAMGSYISNEPFLLKNRNIKFNILNPKDYGFDFYGGILFTSNFELENNPKRVQDFQKAILKGWEYAFLNIEESIEIIMSKYNTQNKTYSALFYEANSLKKLSGIEENKLGLIEKSKLEEIQYIYTMQKLVQANQKLSNFIVYPSDVILSSIEKNYLKRNTLTYLSKVNAPFNNGLGVDSIELDYIDALKSKANMDIKIKNDLNIEESLKLLNKNQAYFKANFSNGTKSNDYLYTKPIAAFDLAIATNLSKTYISSTSILEDKKVAIRKNSLLLKELEKKYPNIKLIKTDSTSDALKLLSNDEVYAVIDLLPLLNLKILENNDNTIRISGVTGLKFELKYILNKEDKILQTILNKIIQRIDEKVKNKIDEKYNILNYETIERISLFYKILIVLVLLLFIFVLYNIKLINEMRKRKKLEKELHKIADTDELTNLNNRRKMIKILINSIAISRQYKKPLSIIFLDIDNFKIINDTKGHAIGDDILKEFSKLINKNIRSTDTFGRWGGEEFLLILPNTSTENAKRTAENLKDIISSYKFKSKDSITSSFGVTTLRDDDDKKSFIRRADEAMYFVKENGKNAVKVD